MRILVQKQGQTVSSHDILTGSLTIGRSKRNQVILPDSSVSREHGRLFVEGGKLFYEDLKSINGSFYLGKKIDRIEVIPGNRITLGAYELFIEKAQAFDPDRTIHMDEVHDTTFAEASTDIAPEDKTAPPSSPPESTQAEFIDPLAVRPKQDKTEYDSRKLNVLQNFLKDEEPARDRSLARLVRLDGPQTGSSISLEKNETTLGKSATNDVIVSEQDVSSSHAVIENAGNHFILKNHDQSTNTFIDGVPIQARELENHDVVEIGSARFEFVQGTSRSRAEGSKIIERSPSTKISRSLSIAEHLKPYTSDWRVLGILGALLGFFLVWLVKPTQEIPPTVSTSIVPTTIQEPKNSDEEKVRVLRFHLDRAKKLIEEKKYDEAESRLNNLLDKLSPNHPEAIALLQRLDEARSLEEQKTKSNEEEFSPAVTKKVTKKKKKLSKADEAARLKKLYQKGVSKYESGDLRTAETLLQEVAETRGSPYQSSAKNLLKEIQKKSTAKINNTIQDIQTQFDSGDPAKAYEEAQRLAQKNPDSKQAFDFFHKIQADLESKAKKAYMEGITFLEVVEDKPAALERFQEALRFSPDPQSRYHQKADQKIRELQNSTPNH